MPTVTDKPLTDKDFSIDRRRLIRQGWLIAGQASEGLDRRPARKRPGSGGGGVRKFLAERLPG